MDPARQEEREAFKALRRENKDVWSRLASIAHDAQYVEDVRGACYPLPLVANLRCGAWYTDPAHLASTSYFKSTDGHMHQWDFSLKRANLNLVHVIQSPGVESSLTGCLIIDSTRRGKRYPDALSKTAPIWCAVLNRASHRVHGTPALIPPLHVPPEQISPSEHAQIEAQLDVWIDKLCTSDLPVPCLVKPLHPVFVHAPHIPALSSEAHHHVVLVSVSPSTPPLSFHTMHASYVQGAGDDHEAWAHGLTPALFWRHKRKLMAPELQREERIQLVCDIVQTEREQAGQVAWLSSHDTAIQIVGTPIYIQACPTTHKFCERERVSYALIVHCAQPDTTPHILGLGLDASKRGLNAFSAALPRVVDTVTDVLRKETHGRGVLFCCTDGSQLSGAMVVATLAASFDKDRHFVGMGDDAYAHLTEHRRRLSKDDTQRRLQWLTASSLHASPSRAHLQRVNAYLLGPFRQVRLWS